MATFRSFPISGERKKVVSPKKTGTPWRPILRSFPPERWSTFPSSVPPPRLGFVVEDVGSAIRSKKLDVYIRDIREAAKLKITTGVYRFGH